MNPIDIPAIEQQARRLRAAEIRRVNGLFAERARLVAKLAAESFAAGAASVSEALRPAFSWNPRPGTKSASISAEPVLDRMNHAARALFSWNPQAR
ncbi:MAG TPA: hypothetical protein VLA64_00940 [Azonexus sp.]|nr:hypothetical protein [Azonexus sp.]